MKSPATKAEFDEILAAAAAAGMPCTFNRATKVLPDSVICPAATPILRM